MNHKYQHLAFFLAQYIRYYQEAYGCDELQASDMGYKLTKKLYHKTEIEGLYFDEDAKKRVIRMVDFQIALAKKAVRVLFPVKFVMQKEIDEMLFHLIEVAPSENAPSEHLLFRDMQSLNYSSFEPYGKHLILSDMPDEKLVKLCLLTCYVTDFKGEHVLHSLSNTYFTKKTADMFVSWMELFGVAITMQLTKSPLFNIEENEVYEVCAWKVLSNYDENFSADNKIEQNVEPDSLRP